MRANSLSAIHRIDDRFHALIYFACRVWLQLHTGVGKIFALLPLL